MTAALANIPVEGMSNPGGYVLAVKQCGGCNRLIWWSHHPDDPDALEPDYDVCPSCKP